MGRLACHLRPAHVQVTETLDDLCDRLITTLLPDQRSRDDSALLVARTQALAPENVSCLQLQDDPTAAGQARAHVRAQLAAWNLDELIMTTELVASELVGNVVRHARGPITLRLLRGRTLICEVADASPAMPRIRRAADTDENGRGLQLIAAVTSRWGVVGQRSGDQQGRQQAERVGSERDRQHPGAEVPLLLEDDQQRGGRARGDVQRCEDGSRPGERSGRGKQPVGAAGLRGRQAGAAVMP
ncbi:ATP-binding protein [Streptomyces sp. NBC_01340]|uniref:ATP-binding protein n=1 Tax=Streptomyces sp. NBC_01340 TaxID=2903830 RepID=UPI003DA3C878